jgi:hypothetical protein
MMKAVVRANQNNAGIYGTVTRIGRLAVGQTIVLHQLVSLFDVAGSNPVFRSNVCWPRPFHSGRGRVIFWGRQPSIGAIVRKAVG